MLEELLSTRNRWIPKLKKKAISQKQRDRKLRFELQNINDVLNSMDTTSEEDEYVEMSQEVASREDFVLSSGEERVLTIPNELLDRVQRLLRAPTKETVINFPECKRYNRPLPPFAEVGIKELPPAYCLLVKKNFQIGQSVIKRNFVLRPLRYNSTGSILEFRVINGDNAVRQRTFGKETAFLSAMIKNNHLTKVSCNAGCAQYY